MSGPKRHRWVKLRLHVYICRDCGMGRENVETMYGQWATTYHFPTGESRPEPRVPVCAPGPLTEKFLTKYAQQIADWRGHRHAIDMRPPGSARPHA
jgi:hypothetical protein